MTVLSPTLSRVNPLPPDEARDLASITSTEARNARVSRLHALGWSLASLAETFEPARSRSTIRAWGESATAQAIEADEQARPELPVPPPA
jgi:hypothetical protein